MNHRIKMENLKVVPATNVWPSKSVEAQNKFTANNVYSYLQDNAIPLQNSPYNSLSTRVPVSMVSPKQVLYQAQTSRQTQNYFVGKPNQLVVPTARVLNNSNSATVIQNRSFERPQTTKVMKDEQLQVQLRKVNTSCQTITKLFQSKQVQHAPNTYTQNTQTPNLVTCEKFVQTEQTKQDILIIPPEEQTLSISAHLDIPSIFQYGRQRSISSDHRQPRQAVSMAPPVSPAETLMQLVFLNDPYVFEEIEQMKQFKSVQSLITTLSETLDEELHDVDQRDFIDKTQEVNGRVRLTLKLCHEVLGKVLEAIDDKNIRVEPPSLPKESLPQSVSEYRAPWDHKDNNTLTELSMDESPFELAHRQPGMFLRHESEVPSRKDSNKRYQTAPPRELINLNSVGGIDNLRLLVEEAQKDVSNPLEQLTSNSSSSYSKDYFKQ